MSCPACSAPIRPGAKFCEQCGARLDSACPSCGARLSEGSRFCGECGAPVGSAVTPAAERFTSPRSYTPAHLAERILRDRGALSGERKQVTVLFADVSGFTSISERLDPEDVHSLINRAFELMLAEIHRHDGTVNQFLGDGLMALFGAPIAHEDHAQRAAHAALAMQRALGAFRDELLRARAIDFRVRMGLNTGLVVVGAIGDNLRMDYTAVGDTTNTAARMLALAEPGQIVVAESTERLVAPYFELAALGTFALKNRAQPVAASALLAARPYVSRLAARAAHGLSPFVGRDDTLAMLERAWQAAREGQGQAALVVGEPGIGKSRLLLEFRRLVGAGATWLEGDCISFGQAIPFLPVIAMLKQRFGIDDGDDDAAIGAKIDRAVAALGAEASGGAPYLRYLLSVDPGDPAVAAMDAGQRRARIVSAVLGVVTADSARRPVVLVVEDAHWIDPASEDVLTALVDTLPGIAVLVVVTYRAVYQQPFGERTYLWRVTLRPVAEEDAVRIVRATLAVSDLPPELATTIARKADGNPFFLEEIGRSLVESGAVSAEGGRLTLVRAPASIAVPDTVQDVIAARIDRLAEPQKRTVQTASVIGREFALTLLRRVSDLRDQLERSLGELKRIELIYEKRGAADLEYVFRHALTQDVAYTSLLQAERRRVHALIGAAIEDVYAGRLEERVEELVHHFGRGEVWDKVVPYAREAADKAVALFLDARGVELYRTALDALTRLPSTPVTERQGVDIRLAMRAPLWRGGQLDELSARFKEAEAAATAHGFTDALDTIYAFLVQYHWAKGEHDTALEYGRRCLERADARDDVGLRVTGLLYLCHIHVAQGDYAEGLRQGHALASLLAGRETERFGLSGLPYCGAQQHIAECLVELGDAAGALVAVEEGERVARAAGHLYSEIALAATRGIVLVYAGRVDEAIPLLEATDATCREKQFLGQRINALRNLGRAYAQARRPREAITASEEAIRLHEGAKVYVNRSLKHGTIARAYLQLGQLELAQQAADTALEFSERCGERGWTGWCKLDAAEIALRRGDRAAAETLADEAQEIAEELGMRPLLERCRALLRGAR
jgi:class 3 adenylate cyclase/tetratricopeptide (TPR) repeat protein